MIVTSKYIFLSHTSLIVSINFTLVGKSSTFFTNSIHNSTIYIYAFLLYPLLLASKSISSNNYSYSFKSKAIYTIFFNILTLSGLSLFNLATFSFCNKSSIYFPYVAVYSISIFYFSINVTDISGIFICYYLLNIFLFD